MVFSRLRKLILLVGTTLALSSCAGTARIVNFPLDPGGRSLNSRSLDLDPEISGNYIVFASDRNGSQDIYLFDVNTRQTTPVLGLNSLDEIASQPSISEDGRYIVFAASRRGESDIYLFDREFQQKRNLTNNTYQEVRNPNISADGATIVYEIAENGQWDLVLIDRSGDRLDID
ncbi:TolB family protein [[Limnothrix rosea] IAM M-220]|uniref:TolB family protein n=1 Tax=[Limnothrix rosea] IAM M-220 TaxID=454133 RepID=UPI00095DA8CC|nr:TolB family protein [[Limnothrix rosea] IAM M-220]OKH17272.1 Tol biopolymer transporter periplasmic protein [[Limnothrix rosea] IAM M-220]